MRSRVLGGLVAIAATAVMCASASAATICVPGLVAGCDSSQPTVAAAMTAANAATDADTVVIAAGSFPVSPGIAGLSGHPVQIVGAGIDRTTLELSYAGSGDFYGVTLYGTDDSISDLTLHEAATGHGTALYLDGASAQRVRADQRNNTFNSYATAVQVRNGASFLAGEALAPLGSAGGLPEGILVDAGLGQTGTVSDSLVQGYDALYTSGAGTVVVSRSRVVGNGHAVFAYGGTTTIVEDSTLSDGPSTASSQGGSSVSLTLRHDTLDTSRVEARGDSAGDAAHAIVSNTALIGGGPEFTQFYLNDVAGGPVRIDADHSFYAAGRVDQTPGASATNVFADGGGNVIGTDAKLLPDLELPFDSPLVDAGGTVAGGESATDLAGGPRIVNGRTDIGAYEYGRHTPTVEASAGRSTGLIGEQLEFFATVRDADPGEVSTVTWLFDDGATATGAAASHAFTTPGTHVARATATDPAGLTADATVLVTVTAPPALNQPAAPAFLFGKLKARKGIVRVALSCPATATDCAGTLTLQLKGRRIGRARYAFAHGTKKTVRVKLNRSARRRLAKARHGLRVRVVATPKDAPPRRKTVRLTGR